MYRSVEQSRVAPGYLVSRPGSVRAWFRGAEVGVCQVVALTPEVIHLGVEQSTPHAGDAFSGLLQPRTSGRLWLGSQEDTHGPMDVRVDDDASTHPVVDGGWSLRRVTIAEDATQRRGLAAWIGSLRSMGLVGEGQGWATAGHSIREPSSVLELLEYFVAASLSVRIRTGRRGATGRIAKVDVQGKKLVWCFDESVPSVPLDVEVTTPYGVYGWPVVDFAASVCSIPTWIAQTSRRQERRCPAPPGTVVSFVSQDKGGTMIQRPVEEISLGGLSFKGSLEEDLVYPGKQLGEVCLRHPDGRSVRLLAEVRSCAVGGEAPRVGLRCVPPSPVEAEALRDMVDASLYPKSRSFAADGWSVFETSGYFNLSGKQPEDFAALRRAYVFCSKKMSLAPQAGQVAYWPAKGKPLATMSHLRVHSGGWLVCQISKVKSAKERDGLWELYNRVYEKAQDIAGTRWWITYVQDVAPNWSKRVHIEVPERFVATGEGYVGHFRAQECSVQEAQFQVDREYAVDLVTDRGLCDELVEALQDLRPASYLDALDLTLEEWNLGTACRAWREAGLERARAMLVARHRGQVAALAVAERAEPGAHLFGLLDCVRVFPLRPGGEEAFGALLDACRSWYAQNGRRRFVVLNEYPYTLAADGTGVRDLGGASLTLLAAQKMPDLLQRVCNLASSYPAPPASQSE